MFRSRKRLIAFFAVVVLAALQLHSMLHWFGQGREDGGAEPECALCVQALHQQALVSPEPSQAPAAVLGFELALVPDVSFRPQFRCFTPDFRGPPAVS
jgi:hypothetical protein